MRTNRITRLASLLGVVAFLLVGCGDDAPGGGSNNHNLNNVNDNSNYNTSCPPTLTAQGQTSFTIMAGAQIELTQRVADCNAAPLQSTLVSYTLAGSYGSATLSVLSAVSGSDGLASTTLTAGSAAGSFQVTATTPGATAVTYNVTVTVDPVGIIVVNMSYGGAKVFDTYQAYLFQNRACESVDPFNVAGAVMGAAPVSVITAHPTFPGVPPANNYAVAVVSSFNGDVLGFGCVNNLVVTAGQTTTASVTITDLPVRFNGLYYLDNHFDLTNALPPSVSTVLHIFDEMTDDHSLAGDFVNHQYGLDPAAFILDMIFRQFCCWEATGTNPTWDTCRNQATTHPYGDLRALYDQNFQSWSGAQPIMSGACGALDQQFNGLAVHQHAQQYLQDLIDQYVPDAVTKILQIVGDLARVFTQMHIHSELTVADVFITKTGDFTHVLKTLEIEVHDLEGVAHTFFVDLAGAGMTNLTYSGSTSATDVRLNIPPHDFILKFGKLVQYIYLNYILQLFNVTNTAELLGTIINCNTVGGWLYDFLVNDVGINIFAEQDLINYCTMGLTMAGNYIDDNIDDWIAVDATFSLQGHADAGQLDAGRIAHTLVNGVWNGTIEEGTWNAPFTGTFTGTKTNPNP
ncbi:MAG: hypothetical protein RBU30_09410 [Polyangia bacterium]|jgi:hypothetical protein|nr:hypothetical protein [Polyangia bacterium]